jgi:diadenosine tetraphosphate (Ap4A) HIT family hydrolase
VNAPDPTESGPAVSVSPASPAPPAGGDLGPGEPGADAPAFTDADLARLQLSSRLRDLSEALRVAVAAQDCAAGGSPDGGGDLAAHLWDLMSGEYREVQAALVGYARSRGSSWPQIAELTGSDGPEEAERRWSDAAATAAKSAGDPADAAARAAALDAWYVLHAQLEPLARVRDPFSRLLAGRTAHEPDCLICAKYDGRPVPAWAGYPVPPGGHLVDDDLWRVGHGPTPYWPAGTLLIESRRHFLDYADFTAGEAAAIGPLIQRFTDPLKLATGASRIHIFSCMEGTGHFHLWMVPRTEGETAGRTFIGSPGYCTPVEAEAVVHQVRALLARTGQAA